MPLINKTIAMQQHRRIVTIALVALSLVYILKFYPISRNQISLPWDQQDVLNSTLGFEKIFVINLPSRRDRRDAMAMAGVVSNLNLTFIEGLTGSSTLPRGEKVIMHQVSAGTDPSHSPAAGARGSWASHVSALQRIVDLGLGSALVLEDDVDWDVRLKMQMETFAAASRMWLDVEKQKRRATSRLLRDSETARPQRPRSIVAASSSKTGSKDARNGLLGKRESEHDSTIPLPQQDLLTSSDRHYKSRARSLYGDDWDVLWLGHCGADLPGHEPPPSSSPPCASSLKISIPNDKTVPAPKHLRPHPFALRDALADAVPPHTRVVHAACGNACSLAYAVSHRGARKLLRLFTTDGFASQWDLMLRDYCAGFEGERLVCLTVQPPLFSHHYGGEGGRGGGASVSDIRGQGGGFAGGRKGTPYVRLSVQENLERLVAGFSVDELVDQLPDDGDTLW
ncbi:hypothetical protein F5Y03DRAFT_404212 [Xylaria venustula]|nr:hypothetical protein F5Y03DRAFT_404212 [Xylaria venustula]